MKDVFARLLAIKNKKDIALKVAAADIANNLTTEAAGKVLDARQGKIVGEQISQLTALAGDGELDTTAQDLTGAVNELVGATVAAAGIDDVTPSSVLAYSSDKTQGLFDQLSAQAGDAPLTTTAQTLSGAVNEVGATVGNNLSAVNSPFIEYQPALAWILSIKIFDTNYFKYRISLIYLNANGYVLYLRFQGWDGTQWVTAKNYTQTASPEASVESIRDSFFEAVIDWGSAPYRLIGYSIMNYDCRA